MFAISREVGAVREPPLQDNYELPLQDKYFFCYNPPTKQLNNNVIKVILPPVKFAITFLPFILPKLN